MTQAAKFFDPVLGIDIHLVVIPPSPAPVPMPHPFIGYVFDVAAGAGAVLGVLGPVKINGMPVANTGTNVRGSKHIPMGASFHANDVPGNAGTVVTGSKTVTMGGSSAGRLGSLVTSCNYPVNLPTSVCLAIPMGAPVLVGGPDSFDHAAAVTAGIRTKWASDKLHGLFKARAGSRLSSVLCFFTGHPVDVMTGAVLTGAVDFTLPGPLPLRFERHYCSREPRAGALGPGWSHTLEAAVRDDEEETTVVQLPDGREVPHPVLAIGESRFEPSERHTLTRTGEHAYTLALPDGRTLEFARVPDAADHPLIRIRDRNDTTIALEYRAGRLARVIDSAGRLLRLRHDAAGRLQNIALRVRGDDRDEWDTLVRYVHDDGHLVAVHDALDHPSRYAYRGGVLVRETDRNGLCFHFEYDWDHPDGWCTRTWGDGGLYAREITYDPARHVAVVDDSRGGRTHYFGNAAGLVERILDAEGGEWRHEWHPELLQRTALVDPLGHRTTWDYDARGNLVRHTDALGQTTSFRHDDRDLPVALTDPLGRTWENHYDVRGNLVRAVDPLGATTTFRNDRRGLPLAIRSPHGASTRNTYDEAGRLVATTDAVDRTTRQVHDERGRLVQHTDILGAVTTLRWDAADRLVAVRSADGSQLALEYDPEGNRVGTSDDRGRRWTYAYAGRGKPVLQRDPLGGVVRCEYDSEENLIAVRNEHDEVTTFAYDRRGVCVREVGFDGRLREYVADAAGQRVAIVHGGARVSRIRHDPLGRIVHWSGQDGAWLRCAYDPVGAILEVTNEHAAVHFERDPLGRVVRERVGSHSVESTHDPHGNRTRRITSLGLAVDYGYDALGRCLGLRVAGQADPQVEVLRDADGLEVGRRLPGGIETSWRHDPLGRPTSRRILRAPVAVLAHVTYEWGPGSELVAVDDHDRGTTRYLRDACATLVGAANPDGSLTPRFVDPVGNIFHTADRTDRTYAPGGRLLVDADRTTYEYDADGNRTRKLAPDGRAWTYRWDGHGRLREVLRPDGGVVRFTYDGLARRLSKEVRDPAGAVVRHTSFVWDGPDLVHELESTGVRTDWIWDPTNHAPALRLQGGRRWSLTADLIGTPTAMFDESGALVWQMGLDILGAPSFAVGRPSDCPWRWPGQYADDETGLVYNRYRYFDGERYLSPDPLGLHAGLHPYAYVPDPSLGIDPLGLIRNPVPLGVAGGCKDKVPDLPAVELLKKDRDEFCALARTLEMIKTGQNPDDLSSLIAKNWGSWFANKEGRLLYKGGAYDFFEHRVVPAWLKSGQPMEDAYRVVVMRQSDMLSPPKAIGAPERWFYTRSHYGDFYRIPPGWVPQIIGVGT